MDADKSNMVKSRQSPKNNDSSSFLAATLVAVSALIIAVSMSDSDGPQILSTSTTASSVSSVDDLKVSNKNKDQEEKRKALVNKHLYYTNEKIQAKARDLQLETYRAPSVGMVIDPRLKEVNGSIDMRSDLNEYSAAQDTAAKRELNYYSPNAVIQGQIQDQEVAEANRKAYTEAYIKQFLENARQNGYIVTLDVNNVVVDVKPIANHHKDLRKSASERNPNAINFDQNQEKNFDGGVR